MAYSAEYKKQILERMKNEKIADIAKETGISVPTLYNWRKAEQKDKVNEQVVDDLSINKEQIKTISDDSSTSKNNADSKSQTISETLSGSLKKAIDEIYRSYYAQMQPRLVGVDIQKQQEYIKLMKDIENSKPEQKKRKMTLIPPMLDELYKGQYEEEERQQKYIKRYEKLRKLLLCNSDNKRAQAELMLVLINEGYGDLVKTQFPQEDYQVINGIINEYCQKTITSQNAIKKIDEWCL